MESKVSKFVSVAFLLIVAFGLVGSVVRPESTLPAVFLVYAVLGWAAGKIVREGVEASKTLFTKKNVDDVSK